MNQSLCLEGFPEDLLRWWEISKRDFPWRHASDPYYVFVAEVLLHRTRASQVVPVYTEFIGEFPTVKSLSDASLDDLRRITHSLGLLWRIDLLHQAASKIVGEFNGDLPYSRKELESLPGVSHYIASAIRCFAFNQAEVLLDTNTVRITGRVFDLKASDSSRRSKRFRELYRSLLDVKHPRQFNWAMIDLGAIICKPKNPLCTICPVSRKCQFAIRMKI